SSSTFLTVTTNGESLKVNGPLSSNEILIVDSGLLTAKITDSSGNTVRNGLSVLDELNFPVLYPGSNEIKVSSTGATFTELHVLSQSRWR
ncbi:phage tail family protein, partial [Virgibacillus soli]